MVERFLHGEPSRRLQILAVAVMTAALTLLGFGSLLTSAQTPSPTATAGACPAGTPASGTPAAGLCVEIGEFDIYFKPNLATIPADASVQVQLPNQGATLHNFSITDHRNPGLENLNMDVDTQPGETGETTIDAPEGQYYFFCDQPGHEQAGMFGYLTVEKDATITTSEATVTPRAG